VALFPEYRVEVKSRRWLWYVRGVLVRLCVEGVGAIERQGECARVSER